MCICNGLLSLEVVAQNSIAIGLYREITFGVGKKTPVATE